MEQPQLVQLEMDEKDKEAFVEMQKSIETANAELQRVELAARKRMHEKREAELINKELDEMDDHTTRAYKQVGKMFLQAPLKELKATFAQRIEACTKETNALKEKHTHVEEAAKKVQQDLSDFVKAHIADPAAQ